ncbi:DMT family transporter [Roseobacteraceae bacterium S113]
MKIKAAHHTPIMGAILIVAYTLAVTISDAFTKHLAVNFEAPQILVICSGTILAIIIASCAATQSPLPLTTKAPRAMALRSLMTVLAAVLFYYSFALLPFADVFLFIAMVPIFTGLMSAPVLGERVSPLTWLALVTAGLGVYLLFPGGAVDVTLGHIVAFGAALFGTVAIVMSRFIARVERNPLGQVFYPQLAIFATMALFAPWGWQPIGGAELAYAVFCGAALFMARYVLAVAMEMLPAYAATPLMNFQFVWMVLVGIFVFSEVPAFTTLLGAAVITLSGVFLVYDQRQRTTPVRIGRLKGA